MRALVILLLLASTAYAQTPDVKGFDHAGHEAKLRAKGKPLACTACHQLGGDGTMKSVPDRKHRPCADAGCHAPWPIPPSREEAEKFCLVCHRKSDVEKGKTRPFYPPYDVSPEHQVVFAHAKHMIPGATMALCATCHPDHGEPAGTPALAGTDAHKACSGCHGKGAAPAMATCDGCHKPLTQALKPAPADAFRVTQRFAHAAHAKKAGDDARRCSGCHADLASAREGAIGRPTMQTCGDCHDGKRAFSVTGTACSRCHALPPGQKAGDAPAVAPLSYSHARHALLGKGTDRCEACHRLDGRWMPEAALRGKDHAPCSDAGCHRPEFFARNPRICAACHADARPFVPASFVERRTTSEFGRDFSHRSHAGGDAGNKTCGRCHQGRFEAQAATQSHAVCAPCHAETAPRMTECAACHGLGKPRGQLVARDPAYPWYVRDKFVHASHATDPRGGGETPCAVCHDQVASATRLAEIARPRMEQCDACHDGKIAFKTTGFGCARCHGPAVKP